MEKESKIVQGRRFGRILAVWTLDNGPNYEKVRPTDYETLSDELSLQIRPYSAKSERIRSDFADQGRIC